MLLILVKLNLFRQIIHASVDPGSDIARLSGILKYLYIFAFSCSDNGCKYLKLCPLGQEHKLIYYLINRLLLNLFAAFRAVRDSYASP